MTGLSALIVPILLSAVIVFVASSIIHMLLPWHHSDYPKLPNEDAVRDALRPLAIPPGDYMVPRPSSTEDMRSPGVRRKDETGPGPDIHGETQRALLDAQEPDPLVPLLRRRRALRCLHRRTLFAARRALPARLSTGRRRSVRRLCARAMADVDLVSPRLEHDDQELGRRIDLRAADRGHVRLALADDESLRARPSASFWFRSTISNGASRSIATCWDFHSCFRRRRRWLFSCAAPSGCLVGVPPSGEKAQRSATIYFRVSDIKDVHATLTGQGVRFQAGPAHRSSNADRGTVVGGVHRPRRQPAAL